LISPHGPPQHIYQAWRQGAFEPLTCREQLDELCRANRYPKFKDILQPRCVGLMLSKLQRATVLGTRCCDGSHPSGAPIATTATLHKIDYAQ
jgi:predicted nucleic acid-binding protein